MDLEGRKEKRKIEEKRRGKKEKVEGSINRKDEVRKGKLEGKR